MSQVSFQKINSTLRKYHFYKQIRQENEQNQGILKLFSKNTLHKEMDESKPEEQAVIINLTLMKKELQSLGWTSIKYLGSGMYGCVVSAIEKTTQRRVAIKGIKIMQDGIELKNNLNEAEKEIKLLKEGQGPNIVKMLGQFKGIYFQYILLEECVGTLNQLLDQHDALNEISFVKYAQEIAFGLQHLHKKNIIVKDLKPDNILITHSGRAVLNDLGLSKQLKDNQIYASKNEGNLLYKAPEELQEVFEMDYEKIGEKHKGLQSLKSDAYSLGLMLFQMLEGKKAMIKAFMNKNAPLQFSQNKQFKFYEEIKIAISSLTAFSPQSRATVKQISDTFNNLYFYLVNNDYALTQKDKELLLLTSSDIVDVLQISADQYIPVISKQTSDLIHSEFNQLNQEINNLQCDLSKISSNGNANTQTPLQKIQFILDFSQPSQDIQVFQQMKSIIENKKQECLNWANTFFKEEGLQINWNNYEQFVKPGCGSFDNITYFCLYKSLQVSGNKLFYGIDFMDNREFFNKPMEFLKHGRAFIQTNNDNSSKDLPYHIRSDQKFQKALNLLFKLDTQKKEIDFLQASYQLYKEKKKYQCLKQANDFFQEAKTNIIWPSYEQYFQNQKIAEQDNPISYGICYQYNYNGQQLQAVDFMDQIQFFMYPYSYLEHGRQFVDGKINVNLPYTTNSEVMYQKALTLYKFLEKQKQEINLLR